jgi:phenylacetate-CoA ligase
MDRNSIEWYIGWRGKIFKALMGYRSLSPSAMAEHARRTTPFFERFYKGLSIDNFDSLPILHKHHVKDVPPLDLLSRPFRDKVAYYAESTGSSGSPTPTFLTELEFRGAAMMARMSPYSSMTEEVFRENPMALNGLAMGFTIAGLSFGDLLRRLGACVSYVGARSTLATPERIARAIVRLRPSVIAATPVDFLSWMRIVREDYPKEYDGCVESLRCLLSTAELCSRSRARRIEEAFNIIHIDTYACVEGFFTIPCPCGEKHVPDIYHVEIFDENLKKLTSPGRGRLVFTNLAKRSSPLVRYLLDDDATLFKSDCRFGFKWSILPHGRHELGVPLNDAYYNVEDFEQVIFEHGLFGSYELRVTKGAMSLKIERYGDGRVPAKAISAALREAFGLKTTVKAVGFGTLTKYREVRTKKPLLRLLDARRGATQKVPEYL